MVSRLAYKWSSGSAKGDRPPCLEARNAIVRTLESEHGARASESSYQVHSMISERTTLRKSKFCIKAHNIENFETILFLHEREASETDLK